MSSMKITRIAITCAAGRERAPKRTQVEEVGEVPDRVRRRVVEVEDRDREEAHLVAHRYHVVVIFLVRLQVPYVQHSLHVPRRMRR